MATYKATDRDAQTLLRIIHKQARFAHVTVRAQRGHLYVYPDAVDAIARITPSGPNAYSLSFHRHTGTWELLPCEGDLAAVADCLTTALAPYLDQ